MNFRTLVGAVATSFALAAPTGAFAAPQVDFNCEQRPKSQQKQCKKDEKAEQERQREAEQLANKMQKCDKKLEKKPNDKKCNELSRRA